MRLKFWKSAAALMSAGILMTGCTAENGIMQEPEKPLEKDSQFYINVAISSPGEQSTRTEQGYGTNGYDSHGGTPEEQEIHSILFVFYNSANKYVGDTHVTITTATDENGNKKATTDEGDIVEIETGLGANESNDDPGTTTMKLIVPVSVSAGALKPVKVIAYVNPTVKYGSDNDVKRSLEQALGITRELEEVIPDDNEKHKGFTMSNSVYYSDADRTRPVIAVNIPSGAIVEDKTQATTIINIPVERVVAKVSVNKGDNLSVNGNILEHEYSIDDETGVPIEYTLNFSILGWGLSNVERGSFLIKNFRSSGNLMPSDFDTWFQMTNMSKSEAEQEFNKYLPNWNYAPTNDTQDLWYNKGYRSFWACSPTYFFAESHYPSFSDEYADAPDSYNLIYRSFEDIISSVDNGNPTLGTYGNAVGSSLYTLEHTMEADAVTKHQKRAVTCALVLGQYTLTSSDDEGNAQTPRTFFVRNGVKADGSSGNWIIPDETSLYQRVLSEELNTVLYVYSDGKYKKVIWDDKGTDTEDIHYITAKEKAYLEIVHPDKVVTSRYTTGAEGETYTTNYTPNRFVSVQLKDNTPANTFYLRKGDGKHYPVSGTSDATHASLVEANRALYGVLSVEKYHNGYAFFAVPIEHIWGKTDDKGNKIPKIGDDGFSTAQLGQYGIVRNHFYQLKINGISGIGTGIGDPTSPIVPNVEDEKYYVKTELRVMKWRMMPEQQVTLRP